MSNETETSEQARARRKAWSIKEARREFEMLGALTKPETLAVSLRVAMEAEATHAHQAGIREGLAMAAALAQAEADHCAGGPYDAMAGGAVNVRQRINAKLSSLPEEP